MTSKQIMLILSPAVLLCAAMLLSGCQKPQRIDTVRAPYPARQVFAVAPLRNESGSRYADGVRLADKLTQRLALVRGIDTLPVNRVLSAMNALGMQRVASKTDALQLRQVLGVDALVVGTITAYDPYNPPKLGLNLELYLDARFAWQGSELDTRKLSSAATDRPAVAGDFAIRTQPVTAIAGYYDAADPNVQDLLAAYVAERGPNASDGVTLRRHNISIDLYSEFVSYQLTSQLLFAERLRLRRPNATNTVVQQASQAPEHIPTNPQAYAHPATAR